MGYVGDVRKKDQSAQEVNLLDTVLPASHIFIGQKESVDDVGRLLSCIPLNIHYAILVIQKIGKREIKNAVY